ncbi:MAG: hypothetical protein PHP85_09785 [Gallionella sp.]|nr:hypothetical protein [Gallionella sp.]
MKYASAFRFIILAVVCYPQLATAEGLCEPSEVTRFSCVLGKSHKIASVCSSPKLTSTEGYLQYRFGTPRKIELRFPPTLEGTQTQFTFESHLENGEFESLNFSIGNHEYSVIRWVRLSYSADSPSSSEIQVSSVQNSGSKRISTLKCKIRQSSGQMNLAEAIPWPL